tara:strand:- start:2113 stop:2577 length:465 start_codon:yes stop_codon:yes gene_type:complete
MATLKVTHTEDIVIDGRQQGSTRTMTFENIVSTFTRTFTLPQQTLTSIYTTDVVGEAGSQFDDAALKYVRITNLANEPIIINIIGEGDMDSAFEIQPTESFYLYSHNRVTRVDDSDAIATNEITDLKDIDEVKAYCPRNTAKLEVFAASTQSNF